MIDDFVGLTDIFPTVAELVGAEAPVGVSGVSLASLIRGHAASPRPFYSATFRPQSSFDMQGVLAGDLKYIHAWSDTRDREELYHMIRDPHELEDLAATQPEDLARLQVLLEGRLAEVAESKPIQAELSADEEASLRALGYVN